MEFNMVDRDNPYSVVSNRRDVGEKEINRYIDR